MAGMIRLIGVRLDGKRVALGRADTLDEARTEARFYLDDLRDDVQVVYLWDQEAQQYRGWIGAEMAPNKTHKRRDTLATTT